MWAAPQQKPVRMRHAGTIHQAEALPCEHSLHLTVSACQRNTWADLLAVALPRALELAAEENQALRHALPRILFDHMVRLSCTLLWSACVAHGIDSSFTWLELL